MIGISIITFGLSHLVPADPAVVAMGDHATEEQIQAFREKYGLNKPIPEQYWIYVTNLLRGDLGVSLRTRRPVADDLRDFFPATFELSLTALLLSIP
jgi:peptide/nickel transport system permease protein